MSYTIWNNKYAKYQEETWNNNLRQIGENVFDMFTEKFLQYGFTEREGQWDMSCEIVDAIKKHQHIVVEAGVGIGKTFAYIVPLLFYHRIFHTPIVIATSTIALQEQLQSDIKTIEEMINYYPEIVLIKGQNHFLCRYRMDNFFANKNVKPYYNIYEKIKFKGAEKKDWNIYIPDNIWNQINVKEYNPIFCRQNCVHKKKCYYRSIRETLRITDGIIICNQDLLTINLIKRHNWNKELINDKFEFVVIDEAHNLENKVRSAYTTEITKNKLINIIENTRKCVKGYRETLNKKINKCYEYIDTVFENLYEQKEKQDKIALQDNREIERYYVDRNISCLKQLRKCLHDIYLEVSIQFGMEDTYKTRSIDNQIEELENCERFFISMLENESSDIFWMTTKGKNKTEIILSSCPKNVNKLIETLYFSDFRFRTILTSATITSINSTNYKKEYQYFIRNTNFPIKTGFIAEPKISPFNYDEHALIYYTEDMPHPSKNRELFIERGIEEIKRILEISNGKALILFTAKTDMLEVYEKLKNVVPYKVLVQNTNSSQTEIISEFKNDVNSVLLGTGSYWEGISVEGLALTNLIIFKLPFPVPEPIIDYKVKQAKDGLMEILVPEMIIKLKQGIGRLIRSDKDFGIVSIIDSRIGEHSKVSYKTMIWDALPIKNKTSDINEVKEFYKKVSNQ